MPDAVSHSLPHKSFCFFVRKELRPINFIHLLLKYNAPFSYHISRYILIFNSDDILFPNILKRIIIIILLPT